MKVGWDVLVVGCVDLSESVIWRFCQVRGPEDVETGEQGVCSDVPEELRWEVSGTVHEAAECGAGEWLSAGQGDQSGPAVSEHEVRRRMNWQCCRMEGHVGERGESCCGTAIAEGHGVWACSVSKSVTYQLLKPQLDVVLFEIIFPLMCFNDADDQLWREDPHEYVRKGYGELMGVAWVG